MKAINMETYSDLKYYKEKNAANTLWQPKNIFLKVKNLPPHK